MDRITFDFDTGVVNIENEHEKRTHICTDLKDRKELILAAAGYETGEMNVFMKAVYSSYNEWKKEKKK